MKKPDGGPAFPRPASEFTERGSLPDGNDAIPAQGGMSLRDYLAAAALQAMHNNCADIFTTSLVRPDQVAPGEHREYIEKRLRELAGAVYAIADAMLVERAKP